MAIINNFIAKFRNFYITGKHKKVKHHLNSSLDFVMLLTKFLVVFFAIYNQDEKF